MEALFMQVFERRDSVIAQMRQQVDSHAQSLACSLIAAGHRPPPWLLPSPAGEPQELNGKPIVSELLFARRQITTPATSRTVFQPSAAPSTSFRNMGVPNGYSCVETVCASLDTNQHEEPEQPQTSDNQELDEASVEVSMFSMVQRSRSRQKSIEDRLREKDKAANSGMCDGMQGRMKRSRLGTEGSNRRTASLSSKPCDDSNNAGTASSLPGQESSVSANHGRSTEFLKRSKDGDHGNQGVQMDCSQSLVPENQIVSSDNFVKVPNICSIKNLSRLQVADSVCHPSPETHLLVAPKRLQFDGVESVCMNPASEQMTQQLENALQSAHLDPPVVHPLNEDPSSTSCSQVHCSMSRLLLDGVESEYLNPDSALVKQHQNSAMKCASLDLTGMQSQKESPPLIISHEVPDSMSGPLLEKDTHFIPEFNPLQGPFSKVSPPLEKEMLSYVETSCLERSCSVVNPLLERDTLHTVEGTEKMRKLGTFPDQIIPGSPKSFGQQCSGSHLSHPPNRESLQQPNQLADVNYVSPASPRVLPEKLPEDDAYGHPSQSLIHGANSQCSHVRSAAGPEELTPQNVTSEELSQEQHLFVRPSLGINENLADVDSPLGHHSLNTQNEALNGKSASGSVSCYSLKLGDAQVALTKEYDFSVRNKQNESVVPNVMNRNSANGTSITNKTERDNMTPTEKRTGSPQQDGTEQDTSLFENAVQVNANSYTKDNDERIKSSRPSVQDTLRSSASHDKINLLQSDGSSTACDRKRSVGHVFQVNGGFSSKIRKSRCRSDVNLSRTPPANSLLLNHQLSVVGQVLPTGNFPEKSQPSGRYFLRSSGSSECMSLKSGGSNAAKNPKMSIASDVHEIAHSHGRNSSSLTNVVLHNSTPARSSRSAVGGGVFEQSEAQIQKNLSAEVLTTTATLPRCSRILSGNEENYTHEVNAPFEGQDLNLTDSVDADQERTPDMDSMSSRDVILNPEFDRKYRSYDRKRHLLSGGAIPRQLGDDSVGCVDTMPEFESFDVPVSSPERALDALYDSRQSITFSSDLGNKYNVNTVCGGLELSTTLSGKPTKCSFSDDLQKYSDSNDRNILDTFGPWGLELDGLYVNSKTIASCSSNASSKREINENPLTPFTEKYSLGKLSSRSGSGSEHMGSIPELECFRIDEDNTIAEENENQDSPSGRKALQDITGLCQDTRNSTSLSTRFVDTSNVDLTAESFSSELNHHSNIRNGHNIKKQKENPSTSVRRGEKVSRSLHGRLGRTEILSTANGRHRSEANIGKRFKPSNVVSNLTSFIPLVKQKVQPTTACVKKDVKVKALKAAEAAKRLEEKKQNELEMRKAAAKLERERLKQEKELKQKQEEEQKKKRDADVATRKRQREEVERRERTRKRKCVEEARKQQKQPMDKRRLTKDDKDAHREASDNMELTKNLVDVGKGHVKPDEAEPALGDEPNKSDSVKSVAVDKGAASIGFHAKENIRNNLEESYQMSPYKDSDEEDDDGYEHEQESSRRKLIPSWARKDNLDKILLSNQTLDPRETFARKCSFNLSDVLSVHMPQRGFR